MTHEVTFDVKIAGKHKRTIAKLKPVILGWKQAIEQFCNECDGNDVPYYYNERANVSVLAAGAWKAKMVALEEYHTHKKYKERRRGPKVGSPRCDLLILGPNRLDIQIEAKQSWLPAHLKEQSIKRRVEKYFNKARDDANANTEVRARIGCVFFTPWWSTDSEYASNPSKEIRGLLTTIIECDADLWAWCFPLKARAKPTDHRRFYPGVIVGMRTGKYFGE